MAPSRRRRAPWPRGYRPASAASESRSFQSSSHSCVPSLQLSAVQLLAPTRPLSLTPRSGQSVTIPSTPQSKRRRMSASSFTVQTWTAQQDRWAPRRKRVRRRAVGRTLRVTGTRGTALLPGDIPSQERCSARRLSSRPALVAMSGAAARAEARIADENDRGRRDRGAGATDGVHDGRAEPRVLPLHLDDQAASR